MSELLFAIALLVISTIDLLAYLAMSRRLRLLEEQAALQTRVTQLSTALLEQSVGIDEEVARRLRAIEGKA